MSSVLVEECFHWLNVPEHVHDVDVAFFDPGDLSRANDDRATEALQQRRAGLPWEAKNQAALPFVSYA